MSGGGKDKEALQKEERDRREKMVSRRFKKEGALEPKKERERKGLA